MTTLYNKKASVALKSENEKSSYQYTPCIDSMSRRIYKERVIRDIENIIKIEPEKIEYKNFGEIIRRLGLIRSPQCDKELVERLWKKLGNEDPSRLEVKEFLYKVMNLKKTVNEVEYKKREKEFFPFRQIRFNVSRMNSPSKDLSISKSTPRMKVMENSKSFARLKNPINKR